MERFGVVTARGVFALPGARGKAGGPLLLLLALFGGMLALDGDSATAKDREYSAYADPRKPVLSFLLSDPDTVEDFRNKFGLDRREINSVLAAIRKENEALAREYAESERVVESNGRLSAERVELGAAVSDYNEEVGEAVARTKETVESILPKGRRVDLAGWVDARWRQESREAESEEATYQTTALGVTYKQFATQYNGYTRYEVALPHRKLKQDGGFRVRLKRNGRRAWAPVKEVGPWNTYDNYWQARKYRTMWRDLPRGRAEARAAFYSNYNGGEDEFGREVLNPAGVDLTPAVARKLGLRKYQNAWIYVHYPWVRR